MERVRVGEINGDEVFHFCLSNNTGASMEILNYGGIITSLVVPGRENQSYDVVLGYDNFEQYLDDPYYFGALIGRYANRIGGGCFKLDNDTFQLAVNDGANHLHGGDRGFNRVIWQAEPEEVDDGECLRLFYESVDGEEGFPGRLKVTVRYHLNSSRQLVIDYHAETDRKTVVCLTQHSYFNLDGSATITDHRFRVAASRYTPVDETLIPTGEILPVSGTRLDFTQCKSAAFLSETGVFDGGIDHNFVLDKADDDGLSLAAEVISDKSGIQLTMHTTEPGLQMYTGNFIDGSREGKNGLYYKKHAGFCLEAQHFPDSPNQRHFPSVELLPAETYRQRTIYGFAVSD